MYQRYGVCDCGKWGKAPVDLKESKHFMVCVCGKDMYMQLTIDSWNKPENEITPTKRLHGERV